MRQTYISAKLISTVYGCKSYDQIDTKQIVLRAS